MPQNETPPVQSCSNKNAKGVSGEDTKKSDADATCSSSYTVSSDVSGGETDGSEVDLFDMRESEGDISGERLVAVYDGLEVQEVSDEGIEVLHEEVPDVVDGEQVQEVQEVSDEGIEVLHEEVPDVVDGKQVQEVQEVGDEGIEVLHEEVSDVVDGEQVQEVQEVSDEGVEVLNKEVPDVADGEQVQEVQEVTTYGQEEQEISDEGTGSVDCAVFEEAVCDNGYREADISTSQDSSVTPFMVSTPPRKTGTPKPSFLHGPDILQKPLCELEIRQWWLAVNVWKQEVFYKYETYVPTTVSSEATPPCRKRPIVVEDDNQPQKKRRCCNIQ